MDGLTALVASEAAVVLVAAEFDAVGQVDAAMGVCCWRPDAPGLDAGGEGDVLGGSSGGQGGEDGEGDEGDEHGEMHGVEVVWVLMEVVELGSRCGGGLVGVLMLFVEEVERLAEEKERKKKTKQVLFYP